MADDEEPQVTWDIADVDGKPGITQRMAGVQDYWPEPKSSASVSYPGVESVENQKYSGDSPAIKPWTYVPDPIKVHPLLPGKPCGDTNPCSTLYLHARITADGKLQMAIFAEREDEGSMLVSWDAADVAGTPDIGQLSWEGDKSPDLMIADADAADGVLLFNGMLNAKCDPRLIGPLAPCARVNIWDSCGGGGPVVTYGQLHSVWGCIVDNVLYMHVFLHEVSQLGEYVVLAASDGQIHHCGCDYICECKRVKVELPPIIYNMCDTVVDCPPPMLNPDPYEIYDILGFKQNLCCGADIIADAKRLAEDVIGIDYDGPDIMIERDIAELDDPTKSGGCSIVQRHRGDIYSEYTLLTKHGGLYNGEWTVTQRTGVCESPAGNTFGQWDGGDGFPYGLEADHGDWAEPGLQSFGGLEWPSQEDREEDGTAATCAVVHSMSGRAQIDLLRYGRIIEANSRSIVTGQSAQSKDVYVTTHCCTTCFGCRSCNSGTMFGHADFSGSGPARYIRIELFAHLCSYMYDEASETLDREIIAEMTWGKDKSVAIGPALREMIEGSSVLSQLIAFSAVSSNSATMYLLRKENNSLDTCTMTITYKVGDSASSVVVVPFDDCRGKPAAAPARSYAVSMAARPVTDIPMSGQSPYVPMYDFRYEVTVYKGTEASKVAGSARDMQHMASTAAAALQDGISMSADNGLLTVVSASGERTVNVTLFADDGTTPIQTIVVFVEN